MPYRPTPLSLFSGCMTKIPISILIVISRHYIIYLIEYCSNIATYFSVMLCYTILAIIYSSLQFSDYNNFIRKYTKLKYFGKFRKVQSNIIHNLATFPLYFCSDAPTSLVLGRSHSTFVASFISNISLEC